MGMTIGMGLGLNMWRGGGGIPLPPNIAPTIFGSSAIIEAANSISVSAPAGHAIGDMLYYTVYTANVALTTPGTVAALTPRGQGTASTNAAQRISTYWREATSAAEPDVVFTIPVVDVNDHICGACIAVRGCPTGQNPIMAEFGFSATETVNPLSFAAVTTTINDCLIVEAISRAQDQSVAQFSNLVQPGGSGLTKILDGGTTIGSGGGFAVAIFVDILAGSNVATQIDALTPAASFGRQSVVFRPTPF